MLSALKSLAKEVLPASFRTKLDLARIRYGEKHYKSRYVRHTYGGTVLSIHLTDPLAESWYDHDFPEEGGDLLLLKQHQLRLGAKVFNIGAHQGIAALCLAKAVGSEGMVVAVEANSHNCEIARENRDLNDSPQLVIVEAAAAEKSGTLFFDERPCGSVDDGSGKWGKRAVPCLSVDDLALQYGVPQVLFIDVEGFEGKVLEGATETLKHRPDCFVEVHVGCGLETFGHSPESVVSFFRTGQYDLLIAGQNNEGVFRALEPDSALPDERFFLLALNRQA
jgi:FkbM family methyltransferase